MAPTRELALQIYECAKPFAKSVSHNVVCVYGGAETWNQRNELAKGVDLLIATPGRLHDFCKRKNVDLSDVFIFVLDEADRMLDMGFLPQIKAIVEYLKPERQTLLWSATWPDEVNQLSMNLCKNKPITIKVGDDGLTVNTSITQHVLVMEVNDKRRELFKILKSKISNETDKVLIFSSTKRNCDALSEIIEREGFSALSMHGDKDQYQRERIMAKFRGKSSILIATDVASRGLDIKNIKAVINYDFPNCIEDYIHRIGRTGRAGALGESFTFFTSRDRHHSKGLCDVNYSSIRFLEEQIK